MTDSWEQPPLFDGHPVQRPADDITVDPDTRDVSMTARRIVRVVWSRIRANPDDRLATDIALAAGADVDALLDVAFPVTDNRDGKVQSAPTETSARAGRSPANTVRFGTQRHRVLEALYHSTTGLTNAEIAAVTGISSRNQAATRTMECRESGWVEYARDDDGRVVLRRTSEHGEGRVHRITTSGRVQLDRLNRVAR